MQTVKTAVVVVLLLAVLYGVYTVLNTPEHELPELEWPTASTSQPPVIELGQTSGDGAMSDGREYTSPAGSSLPGEHVTGAASGVLVPPQSFSPAEATSTFGSSQAAFHNSDVPPTDLGASGGLVPYTAPTVQEPPSDPASSAPEASAYAVQGVSPPESEPEPKSAYATGASPAAEERDDPQPSIGARAFVNAKRSALNQIEQGNYREALFTLSIFYNSPDLTPDEQEMLLNMLDPLAGKVIYSTEHLVAAPHKVGRDQNLIQIAEKYNVPWQLLANINGISDPRVLVPGVELKIVPGPFRAEVDLSRGELTLFVSRLYAGRFPISVGDDPAPQPGSYEVREKQRDRTYYAANRSYPPGDPQNPFGSVWLDLGNDVAIHGSPASSTAPAERLGCISLSPRDANDIYGILAPGSQVIIRR